MATWEDKVNKVIAKLSYAAWYDANHDRSGKRYKRHRPYTLPEEADRLVEILGWHDRREAEIEAKNIMEGLRRADVPID